MKHAETSVRNLTNHYKWIRHKYGDVRYCIHCGKPLPKTEQVPDFLVSMVGTYIEAKNSDSTGTWRWTELLPDGERANQRQWLIDHGGWLFIELGEGRAPVGRSAFLVPFYRWVDEIEPQLLLNNQKSIRKETVLNKDGTLRGGHIGGDELLHKYALTWEPVIGWTIPFYHTWWSDLRGDLIRTRDSIPE